MAFLVLLNFHGLTDPNLQDTFKIIYDKLLKINK